MRLFRNLFVFLILLLITFPVFAEDQDSKPKKNSSVYIGGGFVSKQTYLGSSSRRFIWTPVAAFKYHNQDKNYFNSFEFYGPSASLGLIDKNSFSFGLIWEYDFGRQRGDDNSLFTLEEIDPGHEVGLDFEYKLPHNFSLSTSMLTAVDDPGDSITADFSLNYTKSVWITFEQRFVNKTSLSYQYGNSEWMDTWFGTPMNAKYTSHTPGSGFYGISIMNNLVSPITDRVAILINAEYQRLMGDAGDSPLVDKQGSPNQYSLMVMGLFKFYSF